MTKLLKQTLIEETHAAIFHGDGNQCNVLKTKRVRATIDDWRSVKSLEFVNIALPARVKIAACIPALKIVLNIHCYGHFVLG